MSQATDSDRQMKSNKQKIENLRLAQAVYENADLVLELYNTDWSEQQKIKITQAQEKGAELLETAERESKWNLQQSYGLEELMRTCNLQMQPRDLYSPEDKHNIVDILAVKKLIQERKNNHNKGRVVSFTDMLENALAHIDAIEQELRVSQLDATELAAVPHRTLERVERAMNVTSISLALRQTQEKIDELEHADADLGGRILSADNSGDMVLAEELAMQRIQLQERRLLCVKEKFAKIAEVEAENEAFRHIYEVQRAATQQSQAIRDEKRHLKQRCDADLKQISDMVLRADYDNTEQRRKFTQTKQQSDRMLAENLEHQAEGWRRIQDIEAELRKLAQERQNEMARRLKDNELEGMRQVKYNQLLEVVRQHRNLLEVTCQNCEIMQRCTVKMDNLVMEACSAIKTRYDALSHELSDLKFQVHKEYLEYFRILYKQMSQMIHRKERKAEEVSSQLAHANIHLQFCVETFDPAAKKHSLAKHNLTIQYKELKAELEKIRERRAAALEEFRPTEEALIAARYEFVDPVSEGKEQILDWRRRMVEYRAQLTQQEEIKIAAERESIKQSRKLLDTAVSPAPGVTAGSPGGYRAIEPGATHVGTSYDN